MHTSKSNDGYKYFLNSSQLRNGDIILTANNDIFSKGIQYATGGNYSHALMMFNQVSYIHAIPKSKENTEGVQVGNIQRMFFQDKKHACVLRLKEFEKMQDVINTACSFIRGEVAKGYDFLRAIDVKLKTGKIGDDNKKICSQLVAEAYEFAGIHLVKDSSNCSPEELKQSDLLEIVDVELCNLDDMPSITRTELAQSSHQEVHYEIEKKAITSLRNLNRKELSDIYTTKHLLNFLANHQDYDDKEITKCFEIVGYFDDWLNIKNVFPYRYGKFDKFFTYLKNNITETGNRKIEIEKQVINNLTELSSKQLDFYTEQLKIAQWNFDNTKQSFYEKQINLYTNLCNMNRTLSEHCKKYRELNNI